MRTVGALMVAMVLVTASGCRPRATPEATYREFVEALQRGNNRRAWALLSPATKQQVEARSKAIAAASQGVVRDDPEVLLFQGTRPGPIGEVTTLESSDTTARLKVASASGTSEVKLVKDGGKWLVDLTETLQRRGTP